MISRDRDFGPQEMTETYLFNDDEKRKNIEFQLQLRTWPCLHQQLLAHFNQHSDAGVQEASAVV
jgi:hypothetical protein